MSWRVAYAGIMNLMQRRPGNFALGNKTLLYAYLAGGIGIRRDAVVASPCALMMGLCSTHETCQSLRTDVESDTFTVRPIRPGGFSGDAKYLDVCARIHPDGKTVDLFVVNRNLEDDIPCAVEWVGGEAASRAEVATLNADYIDDWNTFDNPEKIRVQKKRVKSQPNGLDYRFPAHSMTKLTVRLK